MGSLRERLYESYALTTRAVHSLSVAPVLDPPSHCGV